MTQFIRKVIFGLGTNKTITKSIEGLQVNFKIEQGNKSDPNSGEIVVYNLSDSSLATLEERDTEIFLNVGYEVADSLLFWGNDLEIDTVKQGVDRVTTIKGRDGGKQLTETLTNISVPKGKFLSQIVKEIVGSMDNITASPTELAKIVGQQVTKIPTIINGQSKENLDKILNGSGYDWSIQNGEFKINESKSAKPTNKIFVLSAASGLLGSPNKTEKGIKFRALLNAKLSPESFISLQSQKINGVYRITTSVHTGNSRGGDWSSECEGVTV